MNSFEGYIRSNGLAGTRNHVLVVSVMDNCNPAVRSAANLVPGVIPVTPAFGRGHVGADKELRRRTLTGICTSPNVGAVVLVSLEPKEPKPFEAAIRESGGLVETVVLGECDGYFDAVRRIGLAAARHRMATSRAKRTALPLDRLAIGMECGGSDGTSGIVTNPCLGMVSDRVIDEGGSVIFTETTEVIGAEDSLAERCINPTVAQQIRTAVADVEGIAARAGQDFFGANPAGENISGGLTTIEEKALGAVAKAGSRPIQGFLRSAERLSGRGLFYMDSTPPAMESMAGLVASGCNLILFSTGQGNPSGNPLAPTIKVCANPRTVERMRDAIDVDLGAVLSGQSGMAAGADRIAEVVVSIASGELSWSEATGYTDVSISRLGPSI